MKVLNKISWFLFSFLLINQAGAQGFVQNSGQLRNENNEPNNQTLYYANYGEFRVHLNRNGFSYELVRKQNISLNEDFFDENNVLFDFNRVEIVFENQSFGGLVEADNRLFTEKFYQGDEYFEAEAYQKITYKEVYTNVDVVFYAGSEGFKYDFIVHPGGRIEDIVLNFKSPFDTYLLDGSVVIDAELSKIQEFVPLSYFLNSDKEIHVDFVSKNHNGMNNLFAFQTQCGDHVFEQTLVIDPMPNLWFGTYISGNLDEFPQNVTVDKEGHIYVVGYTNSINNVATTGAFQETFEAVFDAFLMKYAPDGTKLWGTYIGGDSFDRAYGVTYKDGNLYVCGNSFSSNFATPGVHQTVNMNADDAFLAKFDVFGNRIWCTYYGGELHDFAESVVIDVNNNLYITGHTRSFTNIATIDAHQESFFGVSAGFLAKFNDLGQLIWGTYYGSSFQEAYGLTLDSEQNIIFGGFTTSSSGIASPGAHQTVLGGNMDAFLAKFNPAGQRLWGTYFGGLADDFGYDVCVDGTDNIYLMGNTSSADNISFGTGFQLTPNSVDDGFVAKFNSTGTLQWSTYIGGSEAEYLKAIEPFYNEGVIVVGKTQSDNGIATPSALVSNLQGEYDGFLMKINSAGALEWGTFYGGNLSDELTGVAIRQSNTYIHAVGFTRSEEGIATPGAHQTETFGGTFNGFLTQFCAPVVPFLIHDIGAAICDENNYLIEVGPVDFDSYLWNDGSTSSFLELNDLLLGSTYEFYVNTVDSNNCAFNSDTLSFGVFAGITVEIMPVPTIYCAFENFTLLVDDIYESYAWSTGGSNASEDVILENPGLNLVSVEVSDANGCIASDVLELTILPAPDFPNLIEEGSTNFCLGETVEVSVEQTYFSYLWNDGSVGSSIVIDEESTVFVTVFNELGCGVNSDTLLIGSSILEPNIVITSDPPICAGSIISFALSETFDLYEWSNGSTDAQVDIVAQEGTNWVAIEVSSLCDAVGFDTLYYEVANSPLAQIEFEEPELICLDSEIAFTLPGDWSNVVWQNVFMGSNFVATPSQGGPWQIMVQAIGYNGCLAYDTVNLSVDACYLDLTQLSFNLSVYPNPFESWLHLSTDFYWEKLSVFDLMGQLVFESSNYESQTQINLDFLNSGVYHLLIQSIDNQIFGLIVVKL